MPKRINKAIELLEQGQPVFTVGTHSGTDLTYEGGKKLAKTWADCINIGMEHGAFDMTGLDNFMRGLVDGGPTNSGHRTPAVNVELPMNGMSEAEVRMNAWQIRQVLARGVHGLFLCHAESPDAIRAFVECARYPFQTAGVGKGINQGLRGNGGQGSAAPVWGISSDEYLDRADVWPLNPDGEIMLGLKFENKRAASNVEATTQVPGIGYAEWGHVDMAMSFGYKSAPRDPRPPEIQEARDRIVAACLDAGIYFQEPSTLESITDKIDEGILISGGNEEIATKARKYKNRTMPV